MRPINPVQSQTSRPRPDEWPGREPPWLVELLYQHFLDDFWSTGAGELTSTPLDVEHSPREVYVRAFEQRVGARRAGGSARRRPQSARLAGQSQRCSA